MQKKAKKKERKKIDPNLDMKKAKKLLRSAYKEISQYEASSFFKCGQINHLTIQLDKALELLKKVSSSSNGIKNISEICDFLNKHEQPEAFQYVYFTIRNGNNLVDQRIGKRWLQLNSEKTK